MSERPDDFAAAVSLQAGAGVFEAQLNEMRRIWAATTRSRRPARRSVARLAGGGGTQVLVGRASLAPATSGRLADGLV